MLNNKKLIYHQNKNPAYIENHETPPPLFWAVARSVKAREN